MKPQVRKFIALILIIGLNLPIALPVLAQNGPPTLIMTPGGPPPTAPTEITPTGGGTLLTGAQASTATLEGAGALSQITGQLPNPKDSCKINFLNKGITGLGNLLKKKAAEAAQKKAAKEAEKKAEEELGKKTINKGHEAVAVDVTHPSFTESELLLKQISRSSEKTATDTERLREKAFCLDGLATAIIRTALQRVTQSIVEWINNGFQGPDGEKAPLFISDYRSFFSTLAQAEISAFRDELKNSGNPYARSFFQGFGQALNRRFEDNARYSFNELTRGTVSDADFGLTIADFQRDFTLGGWNAWLAFTQVPYNNPMGAEMEFTRELRQRLRGLYETNLEMVRAELRATGGFLGDRRCIDRNGKPTNVTWQQERKAIARGESSRCPTGNFQYVTPGQIIANTANLSATTALRQFEMADSLTDAMAAIADALINQLFKIMTKGLFNEGLVVPPITADPNFFPSPPSAGSNFIPPFYQTSNWFLAHPDFDITRGISQAIIDEQRTYKTKLEDQQKVLPDLIKWARQLDYCVPGPNPEWEITSSQILSGIQQETPPFSSFVGKKPQDVENVLSAVVIGATIGATIGSAIIPVLGTLVGAGIGAGIGAIWATIVNLSTIGTKDLQIMIGQYMETLLDVNIKTSATNPQDQMNNESDVNTVLGTVFESYRSLINKTYFTYPLPSYMPTVTTEARTEFANIRGYQGIYEENFRKISEITNAINQLEELKVKVDALVTQYNISGETPAINDQFKEYGAHFARLTANMASGDDIAVIDDFSRQISDKRNYVRDYLVGNPSKIGSCEYEMYKLWENDKTTYSKYVRRQPYPFEISHFYAPVTTMLQSWPNYASTPPPIGGTGYYTIPFSENNYIGYYSNQNEGFLFGSIYYNSWAAPSSSGLCDPEFIGNISLTLPKYDQNGLAGDISDIDPKVTSKPNNCGVITRRWEKLIGVY